MSPSEPAGPRPLDRVGGVPLWQQLRADVVARLEQGEFADRFPGEMDLTEQYAVSRHTVREALRSLRQDGLVDSSRGRAPTARQGMVSQELGTLYSLYRELEARGIEQRSHVLRVEVAGDAGICDRLGVASTTPLVVVERVRLADDVPIAADRVWLLAEIGTPLLQADLTHTGLYDALLHHGGTRVTGGRETIESRLGSPWEAELLGIEQPCAVLAMERLGHVEERAVEWRETVVRGDRLRFVAQWGPGHGYGLDADAR